MSATGSTPTHEVPTVIPGQFPAPIQTSEQTFRNAAGEVGGVFGAPRRRALATRSAVGDGPRDGSVSLCGPGPIRRL